MIVDDRTRRLVHEWAARSAGPDVADALMAMLPPFPTEEIATGADLERMTAVLRGEMSELRGEMSELRGEMTQLDAGLRGEMSELDAGLPAEPVECWPTRSMNTATTGSVEMGCGRDDAPASQGVASVFTATPAITRR